MGRPDQLLKYMLELEAPQATHDAVIFRVAPEIPTTELTPDGLLLTNTPDSLASLPAPWCLLRHEAVVDGKMPGDHLDPLAVERCLWRRQARQVQRLEKESANPAPADCAAWIVAPHRPEWLADWQHHGWVELREVGAGCTSIQPSLHPFVWIAANELPLHEALVPFLLARSGQRLKEFIRWVVHVRPPEWLASVVRSLPEVAAMMPEFKPDLSPEDQRRVIEGLRKSLEAYPEAGVDIREHSLVPIARLVSRRLGRGLTEAERQTLAQKFEAMDGERLGDLILDLAPEKLAAWLSGSDAG